MKDRLVHLKHYKDVNVLQTLFVLRFIPDDSLYRSLVYSTICTFMFKSASDSKELIPLETIESSLSTLVEDHSYSSRIQMKKCACRIFSATAKKEWVETD